jgi:hypothetical protein
VVGKHRTAFRQPVDIGRFDVIVSVTAQFGAQVVDGNKEDVGVFGEIFICGFLIR